MNKLLLIIALSILSFTRLTGQTVELDSLELALKEVKNDIDKVQLLNAIATAYQPTDPKKLQQYANQALQLSKKINYKVAEGNAYLSLGNSHIILGDYALALENFSNAQSVFEKEKASNLSNTTAAIKNGLARAYGSIGIVFSEQSNYAKALQYHLKAVRIYEELGDAAKSARIYNNIGIVYQAQGERFKALDAFVKCLKIQEKSNDETVGITTTNIGNIYLDQKNYTKAFQYYTKAIQLFEKYPNPRGLGELYNNLGVYYEQNSNPKKAFETWNLALQSFDSIEDQFGKSDTYLLIGNLHARQHQYDKAIFFAQKASDGSRQLQVLEGTALAEKLLSEVYEKVNKPREAFSHFKLYKAAQDSLMNHENIRKSVQAEMNYEFDKKEVLQKKELEKKELLLMEQSKRHKLQTLFIGLFVVLLMGIGFLIYNRSQLKKNLTLQKELAEYEQKALHLQMNPHFVFNCLGSISSFIVQNGTDSAIKYLSKFSKLMRLTLEYSKEALIPIDKEIESLQNYLELEQLRSNNVFDFTITKSSDIEDDMAIPPLLLQPFVENGIIHGLIPKKENGNISIDFSINEESLICTIIDDGIGFQKSKELKENLVAIHKSMALDITKKRLEMMESSTAKKAKVDINEVQNENGEIRGTKVVLNLPIQFIK